MPRMFIKVDKTTHQPLLGGFVIVKDVKPIGPYREVVFRGIPIEAVVTNTSTVNTKNVVVSITRTINGVIKSLYTHTYAYNNATPLASVIASLNTDIPGFGIFTLKDGKVLITKPIASDITFLLGITNQ